MARVISSAILVPELVLPTALLGVKAAAAHDKVGAHDLAAVLDGHGYLVAVLEAPHVFSGASS